MKQITEYILLPLIDRQTHLKLDEPCIERGGLKQFTSVMCRGLLAHILDTTIPRGSKIQLCHACHNGKCSNPFHLYWGTARENVLDARRNGITTIWEKTVAKYGLEKASKMQIRMGNAYGKGNKDKPKPAEQRKKISDSIKVMYANKKSAVSSGSSEVL
jgi:hypothetical protein